MSEGSGNKSAISPGCPASYATAFKDDNALAWVLHSSFNRSPQAGETAPDNY
jgi:hypothetical protein